MKTVTPPKGIDMVPEHKQKDVLLTVVQLLQEVNQQNERLLDERDYWGRCYHDLCQDYLALKFSDLCQHCQTTSKENTTEEQILCKQCQLGHETTESLRRELIKKEEQIRYRQDCYKTLLQDFYDEQSSHGPDR